MTKAQAIEKWMSKPLKDRCASSPCLQKVQQPAAPRSAWPMSPGTPGANAGKRARAVLLQGACLAGENTLVCEHPGCVTRRATARETATKDPPASLPAKLSEEEAAAALLRDLYEGVRRCLGAQRQSSPYTTDAPNPLSPTRACLYDMGCLPPWSPGTSSGKLAKLRPPTRLSKLDKEHSRPTPLTAAATDVS
eukprot:TRINITY_DN22329_c0_g1_i1.p1 TRINITY_DN22329_c0_g1~~TRINITY_DN22329_c0_g1_i1.p1  ORF type:complete len:193 (+),score=36.31 TRINITY_DN22329_c0_g1_i1:463-1041(+)